MFDSWMGYLDIGGEVLHDGANELCLVGGESRGFGVGHGDVSVGGFDFDLVDYCLAAWAVTADFVAFALVTVLMA
jgi:hypothetical protein